MTHRRRRPRDFESGEGGGESIFLVVHITYRNGSISDFFVDQFN